MRSELRTALATIATFAFVLGSATMAVAQDVETEAPAPVETSVTPTPETPKTPEADEPAPKPTISAASIEEGLEAEPDGTSAEVPSDEFTVADAQFRWGFNDESNNRAFAPGTFNFFSAGKIADPGRGGVTLKESGWKQASGQVRIEKYLNAGKSYRDATWPGLRTDSDDKTMTGTHGPFSNHQVVISGGTGTVDPDAKTATIQWKGSFTVLYYSGYSFFYVTDPTLTVKNGVGTITATLSGFGSSMEDLDKWTAIKPVPNVVLADLGTVDLGKELGFEATPKYDGIHVKVGSNDSPQVRTGDSWGSFPQSFVDYQVTSGTGSYWYSSGGAADSHKLALPLTVSYSASEPVTVTPPDTIGGGANVTNSAPNAPGFAPPPVSSPLAALTAGAPSSSEDPLGEALTQSRPVSTITGVTRATGSTSLSPVWALGGLLMALTLLVGASPFAYSAIHIPPTPGQPGTTPER